MNRRLRALITSETGRSILLRLPAIVVLLSALAYGLALVSLYATAPFSRALTKEHIYQTASRWIFENVPPGSTITGVHWDDRLPLTLPGLDAHRYVFEGESQTLNLYEPDSKLKISDTLEKLSRSDYIAFPTYRLPGSIPRLPEQYPWSTRFFQKLFSGHLGFDLVITLKDRPTFLGVEYNDDLADESFSVYDHPKVAIFKNRERLSPDEIAQRLSLSSPGKDLSLEEILTLDAEVGALDIKPRSNLLTVLLWFATIQALAFSSLPLLVLVCRGLPDNGYGLSKTFGLFLFGIAAWCAAAFNLTLFSQTASRTIACILLLLAVWICIRFRGVRLQLISAVRSNWILVEGIFLGITCVFLLIRFFNSEIYWGEKPMDSTFLRFLTRVDALPPQDPWAAGQTMHYYYVGIALFSALLKLTGIDPGIGYNLAIATLGGLIASAAATIALVVCKSRMWAFVTALGVVSISNLETVRLWWVDGKPASFDTFWSSARVFTGTAFGEYTLWSLLFADLHAHVIAIPFTVLLLGLLCALWIQPAERFSWKGISVRLMIGLIFGFLYGANTWDFISFGIIGAGIILVCPYVKFWEPPALPGQEPPFGERALVYAASKGSSVLWDSAFIGAAALLIMVPYAIQSGSTKSIGWDWVQAFELNSLKQVLLFAGHWILIIVVSAACIAAGVYRKLFSLRPLLVCSFCALYPFILAGLASLNGIVPLPWGIIALASVLIWLGIGVALADEDAGAIGIMVAGVGIVLVTSELLFLIDRMNTIFKSYMCITIVCALSSFLLWKRAARVIGESEVFRGMVFETKLGLHLANTICITLALFGSILNVKGVIAMQRIPDRAYTLDGTQYLQKMSSSEFSMIRWLNRTIVGTPTILEAQGDSYQDFTRVAMHTGLPTVLGWEHHVMQRGTPHDAVEQRKRDIRTIYSTTDVDLASRLLLEYGVDLVVVSKVERRVYPAAGLEKFRLSPMRFPVVFDGGESAVYATSHSIWNPRRASRTRSVVER